MNHTPGMPDRYLDLLKQGFMKRPKIQKPTKEQPIIACERCRNWHRKGQHHEAK